MTCNGCRSEERCLFCGHVGVIDHKTAHDAPLGLPTTGRTKEKQDE